MNKCGCVQFYNHLNFENDQPVCNRNHSSCIVSAVKSFSHYLCKCLPSCSEIVFHSTISSVPLRNESFLAEMMRLPINDLSSLFVFTSTGSIEHYSIIETNTFTGLMCMLFFYYSIYPKVINFSIVSFFFIFFSTNWWIIW